MKLKSRKIISIALVFFMMLTILPLAPATAHAAASDFTKITVGGTNVVPGGTTSGTGWSYTTSPTPQLTLDNYQGGPIVIEAANYDKNALIFDINVSGNCNVNSGNEPYAIHFKAPNARAVTLRINLADGAYLKAVGNLKDGIGVTTDESDTTNPYLEINGPASGNASLYVSAKDRGIALNTKEPEGILEYRGGYVTVKNNVTLYATGSLFAIETGATPDYNWNDDLGPRYTYSIPHLTIEGNAVVELYSKYAALNAVDVEQLKTKPDGHKITTEKSGDNPTYVLIAPEDYVAVTGLSVTPDSLALKVGESETLAATVTPNNATNKDVIWTSSNSAVATVDANGQVTAKAAGTANIVARTVSGNCVVWCPVTVTAPAPSYTISFESNGNGSMVDVSVGETENYRYTLPTSTFSLPNANYEFAYWAVPGIGEKQPGDVINVTSDMTIVAVHTAKDSGSVADAKYTVTYTDGVDGEVIFDAQTFSDKAYGSVTPTFNGVPERAGYTFKGWSPAVASHVTADATYKATWEINEYEVSFWTYEGSGSMSAVTKNYDTEYELPECGFTAPDGKSFDSWSINGVKKNPGDKITVTSNVVVNAVWKNDSATTYTIVITDGVPGENVFSTYNASGNYTKNSNGDYVINLNSGDPIPSPFSSSYYTTARDGYELTAWSPALEFHTTTATDNAVYTATWTPVKYNVEFSYGTEGSGSMSTVQVNYGEEFVLPECGFSNNNNRAFLKWRVSGTTGESAVYYEPGQKATITDNITFVAEWQSSFNLSLTDCKANGTSASQYYVPGTEIYLVANDPQPGYVFDKWVVTTDYNTDEVAISSLDLNDAITTFKMPAKGIRVTATYKASDAPYNVTLITNGGTIASGKNVSEYKYGTGATLPTDADITRDGYTFNGWYDNVSLTGDAVTAISKTATGNKIFYAKWTSNAGTPPQPPTTYTVTVNGGSGSGEYEAGQNVTLTAYEPLTGFVFDKWTVEGVTVSDVTAKTISFKMPENAVTATATYKQIMIVIHKVTFNSDGGSAVAPQFIQAGYTATEPADPTKEGCTFEGWYLDGVEYDFATEVTKPITLTAKWEAVSAEHTHAWGNVTYTWAEDGRSCKAERVCTENSTHKETATATITSAVKTAATETEKGTTTYTATFTEDWAANQTKDIQDLPVLTHEHTYATEWTTDRSNHWHKATCGHDVIADKAAHSYGNDRVCDICNYKKPSSGGSYGGGI